jgi:hypothetical protein
MSALTPESIRTRDECAESAIERVGGDPRLMRATRVPASRDHRGRDARPAITRGAFDVEDRERHKAIVATEDGAVKAANEELVRRGPPHVTVDRGAGSRTLGEAGGGRKRQLPREDGVGEIRRRLSAGRDRAPR